jgi:hypothetical protein
MGKKKQFITYKSRCERRRALIKKGMLVTFLLTVFVYSAPNILADEMIQPNEKFFTGDPVFIPKTIDGQIDKTQIGAYPNDPSSDIPWSAGYSGVTDIQIAFNNGRAQENIQLGTSIPMMTLPSQTTWNSMSNGEKALWLINRERIDRGVLPLHNVETNVTQIAEYYASYLLDNDTWGHYADGNSPWQRLYTNSTINNCHDYLPVAENLAVFVTSGSSIPLPVERSVYNWIYDDGTSWGHRHAILYYPYNDNSGSPGKEGFLGIGRANGGPYQGPFSSSWNFAEIIVMNIFDPCSTWIYDKTGKTPVWLFPLLLD